MDCCPVGKQGPMRATLPVSSIMKNGGPKNSGSNSPPLSPTSEWRRVSVDQALTRQRSPEAVNYKGKGRFGASVIRRTASLDTLYHRGQWSRDYYLYAGQLQVDKSTQTDEGGGTSRSSSRSSEDDNVDRFLRTLLQRPHRPFAYGYGDYSGPSMNTAWSRFGSSCGSLRTAQSSVDGLNQEIERIVLYPANSTQTPHIDWLRDKIIPEGHRAPFGFPRRRSVNTQTPPDLYYTAHSSGDSVCSSPDLDSFRLGPTPHTNYFLPHAPLDRCEKVNLNAGEGPVPESVALVKPTVLRPSLGSAFESLPPGPPPSPPAPAPH